MLFKGFWLKRRIEVLEEREEWSWQREKKERAAKWREKQREIRREEWEKMRMEQERLASTSAAEWHFQQKR